MGNILNRLNEHKSFVFMGLWAFFALAFLTLMTTFFFLVYSGCNDVKSCVYDIQSHTNIDCVIFSYQWIINNRSGCGMWCDNPFDQATCPQVGSQCQITPVVRDYCKYQGFADLFDCSNETYSALALMFLIATFLTILIGALIMMTWKRREPTLNETTPLYASQS